MVIKIVEKRKIAVIANKLIHLLNKPGKTQPWVQVNTFKKKYQFKIQKSFHGTGNAKVSKEKDVHPRVNIGDSSNEDFLGKTSKANVTKNISRNTEVQLSTHKYPLDSR